MNPRPDLLFVFDVESVGLMGEGFAVGAVLVNRQTGNEVNSFLFHCPSAAAQGSMVDREWVDKHVVIEAPCTAQTPTEVRAQFWSALRETNREGVGIYADVPWPVEADFLLRAARENHHLQPQIIYPLLDVATLLVADNVDPLRTHRRQADEKPRNNPLADARQSARLLCRTLKRLDKR